ncbi:LacI family DNA-binding transcriptional regulator [Nocardioides sp. TF02-7]|uniref:LacI family DNA-binding transcriptional regulator n=1 Tax=Nocardioides sp. TF02-7 TaxID=2917724 RepID=UPI001F05312B|nr:LacI family DNA-binding transcriptional regulator [Nocardioides sp. TF02-7]UMG93986.1 LacI family transcriptional regulator [Nocardioides sp. TF02-7]
MADLAGASSPSTIRDVAAHAGVSPATVSNYFHHPERMSAATRERIRSAVETLDFAPNDAARSLRRGRNPVVGYISFELASARTPAILNAISDSLAAVDMQLLSAVDGGDPARERAYLELFERQRIAGVIISPVTDVEPELARLRRRGMASVLCAHRARSAEQASVSVDHVAGGRVAAEHLLSTGRQRLAFVTDTLELPQLADRFEGATRAVRAWPGATVEVVRAPERSVAGGEAAARQLLRRPASDVPDGLLGANDLVALGLCSGLRADVRVPDDVAVMGYDDIEFARLAAVPLSTIRTPQEQLGATAATLLLGEIAATASGGHGQPRPQVELQPQLVVRHSTDGAEPA